MDQGGETLGGLLKRLRTKAGLTQEELAERAEVSARTVSDVERGLRTSIYKDTTKRLADALGLQGEDRSHFERLARARHAPGPAITPLPLPPTRLIGREQEVTHVLGALDESRAVTLTGFGGIGKTRIALEAAHVLHPAYDGRVYFIPLSSVEDPGLVVAEVAQAIGVRWAPVSMVAAISELLRDQPSLIVLDTFEHLLSAATDVAAILESAPLVSFLITSREALHLRGEREISIPTLDASSASSPASALFLERAREVGADVSTDDAHMVEAICRKLQGVPLAIELAAARAKHMPFEMLLDQLEHSLNVLTGGSRDLPARQRTMRDTVAWSDGQLEPEERALFHELSVFAGGWTLQAATDVCSPSDVLGPMSALLDKSLVRRDGERYDMLDVIREFAAESLDGRDEVRSRHASFFHSMALRTEPEIGTSSQRTAVERLAADQDNLRGALGWFIENEEAESALQMGAALWQFWRVHGDLTGGRDRFRQALAMKGGTLPTRAKALWGAAWLAYHQGDYEDASGLSEQLEMLSKGTDDRIVRRNALTVSGIIAMAQSRFADARAQFEQAVDLLRPLGQNWLYATSLLNLGSSCVRVRDTESARAHLEAARDLYERLGDRHFVARASIQLGFAAMSDNDIARAASHIAPALVSFAGLEDPWGIAESFEALAAVRAAEGRAESAATLGGVAEQVRATITVRPHPFDATWVAPFMERARASIDEETWRHWWEEGTSMELERAIELALNDSPISAEPL